MPEEKKRATMTGQQLVNVFMQEKDKLDRIEQRLHVMSQGLQETQGAIESLKALNKNEEQEILVPLGSGVFMDAKVKPAKVKKSIIGGMMIEASLEQAQKDLEKQAEVIRNEIEKVRDEREKVGKGLEKIGRVIQAAQEKFGKHEPST